VGKKMLPGCASRISHLVVLMLWTLVPFASPDLRSADAAPPTAISPTPGAGGLRTIVTPSSEPANVCSANCVITGGTRPGGGTNLFHSFGQFNIGTGDITTFQNGVSFDLAGNPLVAGLQTSNILGRVTGGNLSSIYGTIQTSGFGSANLFLMNPAGFLFGPNAAVNVGGMMTFTTADYLRLRELDGSNAGIFNADQARASVLTSAPVAAFGFIGSNPAAITFGGGQFTVAEGTGLALVGGNVTFTSDPESGLPSNVTAPGRQIQISSVAGAGEIPVTTLIPPGGMAQGTITLDTGTFISTAGDPSFGDGGGGSISIRGGQIVATGAMIMTSPAAMSTGSGGDVTVTVTGSATIADSLIQTNDGIQTDGFTTLNAGPAGAVFLSANDSLSLTNTLIDTSTVNASGSSGQVALNTNGPLSLTDSAVIAVSVDSGNGGAVTMEGNDVIVMRSGVFTDVQSLDPNLVPFRPGAVTITAQNTVTISDPFGGDPGIPVISATATGSLADASPVTITGQSVNLLNGTINASTFLNNVSSLASPSNAGLIEIRGNSVNLSQFTMRSGNLNGDVSTGKGGSILIRGAENLLSDSIQLTASTVDASSITTGGGGSIEFQTMALTISDGSILQTSSFARGAGGSITVRGAETVTIESGSHIDTDTIGNASSEDSFGTAGDILLQTQNLALLSGGQLNARALPLSTGSAGNIIVQGISGSAQSVLIDGSGSGIFTDTQGTGAGGKILVNADNVTFQNGGTLSATTSGTGNGGDIQVNGSAINLSGFATINTLSFLGEGSAGSITLNATQQITAVDSFLNTDTVGGIGQGGNILLRAPTIQVNGGVLSTSTSGTGPAGNILMEGQQIGLGPSPSAEAQGVDLFAVTAGLGQGGTITLRGLDGSSHADNVTISGTSRLHTLSASEGAAGDITINSNRFTLTDHSTLNADTFGSGAAGTITITSMESATISGVDTAVSSSSDFGATGNAGHITLTAPVVTIENGGLVSTSTTASGIAGTISVHANTFQLLSGGHITSSSMRGDSAEQPAGNAGNVTIEGLASPGQSVLIDGSGSGVFTNTEGIGTGGNIFVNANSVTLQNGGMLSVATSGTQASATGGTITVNAGQVQLTSGALITASTTGTGAGGSIAITAGSAFASSGSTVSSSATQATGGDINISAGQLVTLDNGSVITASSNGEGNAGNIEINAGQQYTSTNSSVTTKAEKASGGNITVLATGLVHLTNSEINASVEGSTTTVGGNILVDPVYVILENSQILAQATQGQGGNINIFYTGALLADPSTVISASSQFGQSGTVTIQSPISPASGKIVPLGQKSLVATALLSQRCAAVAGGSISSFTVAGRDSVPAEPGGWLSSPLALSMSAPEDGTVREADRMLLDEAPLLSVRKIAPPGFLTQSFGLVGSAGCTS
jgi:filamentous hemagglutinin family protein